MKTLVKESNVTLHAFRNSDENNLTSELREVQNNYDNAKKETVISDNKDNPIPES